MKGRIYHKVKHPVRLRLALGRGKERLEALGVSLEYLTSYKGTLVWPMPFGSMLDWTGFVAIRT